MAKTESSPPSNAPEISVSELSANLKRTVEDAFGYVRVRGEISGYRGPHSSGHCYFTLKDASARLDAVIWKGVFGRMKFRPEEGMEVIATGKLTTFAGKSSYQIVVDALEPAGAGALLAQLEERRKRLAAEGLFDASRKRAIPYLPEVIGVVTSPTGAVIRDILHRLSDRFPRHVLVWPVRVQGETSALEVAAAIRGFNILEPGGAIPRPDVLIVARGGGSLEDLWGFNDEALVRAVADSEIPVISAVGHETDTTLIDFVADRRAPTPTGAAEFAVPVRTELVANVGGLASRLLGALGRGIHFRRTQLRSAARALPALDDLFAAPRQKLDALSARLGPALIANERTKRILFSQAATRLQPSMLQNRLNRCAENANMLENRQKLALATNTRAWRRRFDVAGGRLAPILPQRTITGAARRLDHAFNLLRAYSYTGVLERGFALVTDSSGTIMRTASSIAPGASLSIRFRDGEIGATADGGSQPQRTGAKQPARAARKQDTKQDDLFDQS